MSAPPQALRGKEILCPHCKNWNPIDSWVVSGDLLSFPACLRVCLIEDTRAQEAE